MDNNKKTAYTPGKGTLPGCAPLGSAYVPYQPDAVERYEPQDALNRGTLFPGLDLPFLDKVNSGNPYAGTPLGEIMALDFVYHEFHLYLDTHPDDEEAFECMKRVGKFMEDGRKEYVKRYGPLQPEQIMYCEKFDWTEAPWPWAYEQRGD